MNIPWLKFAIHLKSMYDPRGGVVAKKKKKPNKRYKGVVFLTTNVLSQIFWNTNII